MKSTNSSSDPAVATRRSLAGRTSALRKVTGGRGRSDYRGFGFGRHHHCQELRRPGRPLRPSRRNAPAVGSAPAAPIAGPYRRNFGAAQSVAGRRSRDGTRGRRRLELTWRSNVIETTCPTASSRRFRPGRQIGQTELERLTSAYFAVQGGDGATLERWAAEYLWPRTDGVELVERARFDDLAGVTNHVFIAYFKDDGLRAGERPVAMTGGAARLRWAKRLGFGVRSFTCRSPVWKRCTPLQTLTVSRTSRVSWKGRLRSTHTPAPREIAFQRRAATRLEGQMKCVHRC